MWYASPSVIVFHCARVPPFYYCLFICRQQAVLVAWKAWVMGRRQAAHASAAAVVQRVAWLRRLAFRGLRGGRDCGSGHGSNSYDSRAAGARCAVGMTERLQEQGSMLIAERLGQGLWG